MSYEKRQQRLDYEHLLQNHLLQQEAGQRDVQARAAPYTLYAQPVMHVYDRIMARNLGLLRGVTLDERALQLKQLFAQQEAVQKQTRRGQFMPLKPEYEELVRKKF